MFFSSAEKSAGNRKTFVTKALLVAIEQVEFYFGSICVSAAKEAKMKKYLMIMTMLGLLFLPGAAWTAEGMEQTQPPQPVQPEATLGSEFAKGVTAPILNLVYFPLKLVVGIV